MNKCNVHEVYRCTVLCTRLCASRRGSVQVDLAGYKRGSLSRHPVWVIACFLQPPPPSFLPLRSLFLRSLQVTRRDMEIIWRIIIVLDQMRLISTPRAKRIRSRESRICESCAASGSQVCYYRFSVWWKFSLFLLSGLKIDFYAFISSRKRKGFWEINSFFSSLSSLKLLQRNSVVNLECTF